MLSSRNIASLGRIFSISIFCLTFKLCLIKGFIFLKIKYKISRNKMTEPLFCFFFFCCCCYERHSVNIWVGYFSWNVLITLISLTSRTVARSCWNESELDYCPWKTSLPFLIPHPSPVFPPKRDQDIGTSHSLGIAITSSALFLRGNHRS